MGNIPQLQNNYLNYGDIVAKGAAIKGQEARNALMQQQAQDYPEDRSFLREQRERARTQWKQEDKDRFLKLSDEERDRAIKIVDTAAHWLNATKSVAEYAEMRPVAMQKLGISEEQYPDPANFTKADGTPDEQAYAEWKDMKVRQASDWKEEVYNLPPNTKRMKGGKEIARGVDTTKDKGEFGGLTANQWLLKLDRDRKFKHLTDKDKAAILKDGISAYNKLYLDPMRGGLAEGAPDQEKYLREYVRLRTGKEGEPKKEAPKDDPLGIRK